MQSIGIVRNLDELGRIVLPVELRRRMNINIKDPLEIFVDGDTIVLRKYQPKCVFCGEVENITSHKGKIICKGCIQGLKE
jgi:transcriptional pleiotropic regulator of transition state genes